MSGQRRCAICGAPLAGRRRDAEVCGPACRRERARIRALLAGKQVDGYSCLAAYFDARQEACEAAEKITRTDRGRAFVGASMERVPGRRADALRIYAAYLRWCEENEPDRPLSYPALLACVEQVAPFDDIVRERRGGRGRPCRVFIGLAIRSGDVGRGGRSS